MKKKDKNTLCRIFSLFLHPIYHIMFIHDFWLTYKLILYKSNQFCLYNMNFNIIQYLKAKEKKFA